MVARFEGILRLDFLEEPVGGRWFKTVLPFKFYSVNEEVTWLITVPAGTLTDFASVPKGFRWLISRVGKYGRGAVLHDYLCNSHAMSRKEADRIFLEAMEALGVGWLKRRTMYTAVRAYSIATFKK